MFWANNKEMTGIFSMTLVRKNLQSPKKRGRDRPSFNLFRTIYSEQLIQTTQATAIA
jgi:hypothetical protein